MIGVMGADFGKYGSDQVVIVCKPPYTKPIEAWVGGLCYTNGEFLPTGSVRFPGSKSVVHRIYSKTPRPARFHIHDSRQCEYGFDIDTSTSLENRAEGWDQQGRQIRFEEGRILDLSSEEPKLLFDTNGSNPRRVPGPPGIQNW